MTAQSFAGRPVLVTGASGFLGSALSARLVAAGAEVHASSRRPRASTGDVRWHSVDLQDPLATEHLLDETAPQVIYHLASAVSGRRDLEFVRIALAGNLVSTVNLLSAAGRGSRPRVVLAGSMEEADGDDPDQTPGSPYAAAKTASSAYGRMFHALYGAEVVILRTFMVYGPGQADLAKLVPYVTTTLLAGRDPQLASGRREVDWVFVDDVIDAYARAGLANGVAGTTLPVGSGALTSVDTVVNRLHRLVGGPGRPQFGALPDRALERPRRADVARSLAALDWRPRTQLDDGLERTVRWFRDGGGRPAG